MQGLVVEVDQAAARVGVGVGECAFYRVARFEGSGFGIAF